MVLVSLSKTAIPGQGCPGKSHLSHGWRMWDGCVLFATPHPKGHLDHLIPHDRSSHYSLSPTIYHQSLRSHINLNIICLIHATFCSHKHTYKASFQPCNGSVFRKGYHIFFIRFPDDVSICRICRRNSNI